MKYSTLHLNGRLYSKDDLLSLSKKKMSDQLEEWEKYFYSFICEWLSDSDCIELRTSGTTGKPKTIFVNKQSFINSALATAEFLKLKPGHTSLLSMSCRYIAAKMMIIRAMVSKLELISIKPTSNPLSNIYFPIDFCALTPMQVANSSVEEISNIKKLIIGGGAINKNLESKLRAIDGVDIFHTYGMTETISHIAIRNINDEYFKTLKNVRISTDYRSCLVIHAPLLCEKQIVTNDIVELKSHDKFLWRGRYDNVINSGGIKLSAEDIEKKINEVLDRNIFISSIEDEVLGEKLVLVIEGEQDDIDISNIYHKLDKYQRPKEIFFTDKFTYTGSGKINRNKTLSNIINNNRVINF
ncbi:AMP-binding protein [Ichthyobacterium seriolicida]|uniref:O-succinylbenzoic acid--CoA ligase n=1 Tax=Ichthyobacterium seriolicida TaxID=242600 RepID=A0A1J1E227_9FLAO|nr:AMP-binding protein [Ichthyobacterium seriolicida]BAV94092.1 O-succinylbenzoic acid--CoA ligase [Ichthyobacterium seriolicida]